MPRSAPLAGQKLSEADEIIYGPQIEGENILTATFPPQKITAQKAWWEWGREWMPKI